MPLTLIIIVLFSDTQFSGLVFTTALQVYTVLWRDGITFDIINVLVLLILASFISIHCTVTSTNEERSKHCITALFPKVRLKLLL